MFSKIFPYRHSNFWLYMAVGLYTLYAILNLTVVCETRLTAVATGSLAFIGFWCLVGATWRMVKEFKADKKMWWKFLIILVMVVLLTLLDNYSKVCSLDIIF